MNVLRNLALNDPINYLRFFDDFVSPPIDDTTEILTGWAQSADAGATAKTGPVDGLGGWIQVACDGDDNDEAYISSLCEAFIFNTTKEVMFEAKVKHTAGSTDGKSSFLLGLSDEVGANSVVDGGTLMASFDGALFFKGEDDSYVTFNTSNAASQSSNNAVAWSDGSTHRLGFLYLPNDGTTAKLCPTVDGAQVLDSNGDPVVHSLTISGLEEMHILLGVKTHEAAEQQLLADWVEVVQER
jgi:hypothetical protein